MSSKQCHWSTFSPHFQHSREMLIPALLLLLLFASPSHGIECYSNENKKNQLRTKNGEDDLSTCKSSSSECYETFKSDALSSKEDGYATYTAGCTPCENRDTTTMLCYNCKESLCNTFYANDIREKNFQCYIDGNQNTFGSRTVYCFTGITECYYEEVTTATKKIHYLAGCGRPKTTCSNEFCKVCSKKLCNFPESMRALVLQRSKKSDSSKKASDTAKAQKAAKKKKTCKDAKDAKNGEDVEDGKVGKDCKDEKNEDEEEKNDDKNPKDGEAAIGPDSGSVIQSASFSTFFLLLATSLSAVLGFVGECPAGC